MPSKSLAKRTTEEVFMDHLQMRKEGRLEDDLKRNYHKDVVIVSNYGTFYGWEGVRQSASILGKLVPSRKYNMDALTFAGEMGFEGWTVHDNKVHVHDGIDAFIIRDGKIIVQTIWYSVTDSHTPKKKKTAAKKKTAVKKKKAPAKKKKRSK